MSCVHGKGHFGVFAFCTRQMSAPPPVARRQSGIRVMLTQGEQPPPSLPIYPNSAKGTNTQTFCHVSLPVRHSRLILIFLNTLFSPPPPLTPAGSENGSNAEANFTSAQREVVCGCINSQDIHPCNQKLERSNDLSVRWHGNLSKVQHLSAITHVVPVAYLHTVQMHNPDIMPRHYAVRARVTVCGFVWSLYGALSETIEYFKM